ncbi:hypothetical protein [Brevibacillus parabrevis]|uniref:hypothetical protein n=1 Tax=Brevibacillus parabrevis TaxID=54914 RepID=UPI002E2113D5|nr:hypothetical protein [Brevibacillus parabrevis]
MKRIACLHAHHSNIALLADAFAAFDVELVPFVDPGILLQSTGAVAPAVEQAHAKLRDHLQWMSQGSARSPSACPFWHNIGSGAAVHGSGS